MEDLRDSMLHIASECFSGDPVYWDGDLLDQETAYQIGFLIIDAVHQGERIMLRNCVKQ